MGVVCRVKVVTQNGCTSTIDFKMEHVIVIVITPRLNIFLAEVGMFGVEGFTICVPTPVD